MRRRGAAPGQSLVEFALLVPVTFFFLFGLFDLGNAIYTFNTLAHGTQTAADFASLHCGYTGTSYTAAQLNSQVLQAGQMLQPGQLTVSANPAGGGACQAPGSPITVTSTYVYHPLTNLLQAFFPPGGLILQTSTEVLAQ